MATVPVRLRKWGNSLAAIIPAEVAKQQGLREGDEVTLEIDRRSVARRAFGKFPHLRLDSQRMKDEDREAW